MRRILIQLLMLVTAGAAHADDARFADTVGTLELDATLDARGNLGGMTVDRLGFVYVANFRDAVWRISPEGSVVELSRSLYGSSGNAVDSRGDLYQASFFGNTITRIRRSGEEEILVADGLNGPVGLAFADDGSLYVCNCSGNSLSRVDPDGIVHDFVTTEQFACPNGIVIADDGNLYVTNFNNPDILRVTPDGDVSTFVSIAGGAGNAHIAFAKGFFYVTKIIANTVVKVSADGMIFPLAGTGQPGHEDGPGPQAAFAHPNGIVVSPQGDRLYVNTMIGAYSQPQPSELTVRTVDLVTLTRVLDGAMEEGGLDAAGAAYADYRADPARGRENTVAEMVAYGYRYLSSRRVTEALYFFRLNAEANTKNVAAQYQLGEAYRYTGQTDAAIAQYRKTLELDASHALSKSRLAQLDADG